MRPFEGCRERINRADAHDKAFAKAWNSFVENDPYYPVVQMQDDGTGAIFVRPTYVVLPTEFSLELGEVLYHLRAALDSCVYDAAILESGQDPPPDETTLAFPICFSEKQFNNSTRNIAPLSNERRGIIEAVQPYKTPELEPHLMVFNFNRTLGILHEWARKDRHRTLHVVGSWASNANPKVSFPDGASLAYMTVHNSGFLENKGHIATFKITGYSPGMNVQGNPDLTIDIAVDEIPPPCADNDSLGNRIIAMIVATKTIVGLFKESFGIHE